MMKQSSITITDGNEEFSTDMTLTELEPSMAYSSNKAFFRVQNSLAIDMYERIKSKDVFFSFEFLPPRTRIGVRNLQRRFHSIQDGGPLFCSVTWHTGTDPGSEKETSTISFAGSMAKSFYFDTILHLAACNLTRDQVMNYLQRAYLYGIRSVLALRGDVNTGCVCPKDGFPHAIDLIRFIREKFGDLFTIGVAGYPSGHHEAESYLQDLKYLKEKVDAGANFIISQIFFSADIFKKFLHDCKLLGINVPVIPGVIPILSYSSIQRIARLCQLEIPPEILKFLSPLAHNDQAATNYGIHFAKNLARELLMSHSIPAVHFFTLNREQPTIDVCKQLGLWSMEPPILPPVLRICISIEQLKDYLNLCSNKAKHSKKKHCIYEKGTYDKLLDERQN